MRNILNIIISIILSVFLVDHLEAQQMLTLEQCRKMALQKNEDLKIADLNINKAKAEKKVALTYYLPTVSGSATGIYLNEDFTGDIYLPTVTPDMTTGEMNPNIMVDPTTGTPIMGPDGNPIFNMYAWLPIELSIKGAYMAGINVDQPIFTGGKIMAGNKMASIGLEMANLNHYLQQMNTLEEADKSYWIFVTVRGKVKLAEKAVDMLAKLKQKVEDAVETGMVQQNELLKVQVQYNKAVLDLQKARSGLQLTRMSLCRVAGLPYSEKIIAIDSTVEVNSILVPDSIDVTGRPEYQLMDKTISMEEQNIKLTRAEYLPTIGVRAGYSYFGGIEFSGSEMTGDNFMVTASVKIPIFSWGQGAKKVASAKNSKDIKQLEFEKNTELLILQIEQAKLNLNDAALRIDMSEKALKQADENLRISNDNYELGMLSITDLLIAQVEWQKTYSELIDAKADYKIKETEYLKVSGKLH